MFDYSVIGLYSAVLFIDKRCIGQDIKLLGSCTVLPAQYRHCFLNIGKDGGFAIGASSHLKR